MTRARQRPLGGALVKKLGLRGVVATKHQAILPAGEVADDLEVVGAWRDARGVFGGEARGEGPERTVHRHEALAGFADVADARPFGIPAVGAIVGVARLRQTETRPLAVFHHHQDQGAEIPTNRPDRVLGWVGVAGESTWSSDFRELIAADEGPVAGAIEGAQGTADDSGIFEGVARVLTVVR